MVRKLSPNYLSHNLSSPNVGEDTNVTLLPKRRLFFFEHVFPLACGNFPNVVICSYVIFFLPAGWKSSNYQSWRRSLFFFSTLEERILWVLLWPNYLRKIKQNLKTQGLTNLIFACSDFCARKMVLCTRSCTQNYVCMKQWWWVLTYIV